MNGTIQRLKADIAQCKKADDLLRQAEGIMRGLGYSIGVEEALDTITLAVSRKRTELGEMVESDPPRP